MNATFKLIIEYDGTAYHGWQRQADQASIQAAIETALATMTRQPVTVIGSGRTDAGVHALGQVAHFSGDFSLDAAAFLKGLNSLLPADICIRGCREMPAGFHARYDATGKTYCYHIDNHATRPAVGRHYVWHVRRPLDAASMNAALSHIVGEHDFSAFEGAGSPRASAVRTLFHAGVELQDDHRLVIAIAGSGFLRFMVRNIVGTVVLVGQGRMTPEAFLEILKGGNRDHAGPTAPPQGLFLQEVRYDRG